MNIDLISADYVEDYKISVVFDNGKKAVVDLSHYANRGGVFERFKDLDYFRNFSINPDFNVLCWQGGADIAPETLYMLATGESLPDCPKDSLRRMESEEEATQNPPR